MFEELDAKRAIEMKLAIDEAQAERPYMEVALAAARVGLNYVTRDMLYQANIASNKVEREYWRQIELEERARQREERRQAIESGEALRQHLKAIAITSRDDYIGREYVQLISKSTGVELILVSRLFNSLILHDRKHDKYKDLPYQPKALGIDLVQRRDTDYPKPYSEVLTALGVRRGVEHDTLIHVGGLLDYLRQNEHDRLPVTSIGESTIAVFPMIADYLEAEIARNNLPTEEELIAIQLVNHGG